MSKKSPKPLPTYRPYHLGWFGATQFAFYLIWYFFGLMTQGVDLAFASDWATANILPLLPFLAPLAPYFALVSWGVLRHLFLPMLVGNVLANHVVVTFLHHYYNFPERKEAKTFLSNLQSATVYLPTTKPPQYPPPLSRVVRNIGLISGFFFILISFLAIIAWFQPNLPVLYRVVLALVLVILWGVVVGLYLLFIVLFRPDISGVQIKREELAELHNKHALLRVGGPGWIIVGNEDAVVTEYNGRQRRVLGPGRHRLEPYEYVLTAVDLRQHERSGTVTCLTQDGIELSMDLSVTFRISSDDRHLNGNNQNNEPRTPATRQTPYPFGQRAVRAAVYSERVLADGVIESWLDQPLATTAGQLRLVISRRRLEQLLPIEGNGPNLQETLWDDIRDATLTSLWAIGIDLISVNLGSINTPQPVVRQYIEHWQAFWQRQQRITLAEGQARVIEEVEMAHIEAETAMFQAIAEGWQRAWREGGPAVTQDIVALRLIEALEKMAPQTSKAYTKLESVRRQLLPAENN